MFSVRVQVPTRADQLAQRLHEAAARTEEETEAEFAVAVAAVSAIVAGLDPAAEVTATVTSYRQPGVASVTVTVEGETDRHPPAPAAPGSARERLRGLL